MWKLTVDNKCLTCLWWKRLYEECMCRFSVSLAGNVASIEVNSDIEEGDGGGGYFLIEIDAVLSVYVVDKIVLMILPVRPG